MNITSTERLKIPYLSPCIIVFFFLDISNIDVDDSVSSSSVRSCAIEAVQSNRIPSDDVSHNINKSQCIDVTGQKKQSDIETMNEIQQQCLLEKTDIFVDIIEKSHQDVRKSDTLQLDNILTDGTTDMNSEPSQEPLNYQHPIKHSAPPLIMSDTLHDNNNIVSTKREIIRNVDKLPKMEHSARGESHNGYDFSITNCFEQLIHRI